MSYLTLSELSTNKVASKEYINFTKKRLQNEWVKDTTETIILASHRNEFFKNEETFRKTIEESNIRSQKQNSPIYSDSLYSFVKSDYYNTEPFIEISNHTDSLKSNCCIVYKLSSEKTIPLLIKKINFQYFYSDSDTDYHIMFHNSQMELKTVTYLWLLGFWIKIKTVSHKNYN